MKKLNSKIKRNLETERNLKKLIPIDIEFVYLNH